MSQFSLNVLWVDFLLVVSFWVFFFNDTATTEIYTLSLHDALPILLWTGEGLAPDDCVAPPAGIDRKSTRLNSSHVEISYAVFCLKKKKQVTTRNTMIPLQENLERATITSRSG